MEASLNLTPSTIPNPEVPQRLFQCSTCKRSFTRVDHLTRHVRSHTRQKPYVCPTCSKGFARVDLLKRHAANHTGDQTSKRQRRDTVRQSRVVQACEACSQNHLRCEDDKPCSRCRKKGIDCRVPASTHLDELDDVHAAQDLLDLSNNFDHTPSDSVSNGTTATPRVAESEPYQATLMISNNVPVSSGAVNPGARTEEQHYSDVSTMQASYLDTTVHSFDDISAIDPFLPGYLRHMPPFETPLAGHATPRGIMDMSFDWNVDLNDLDLGLLDQYNFQVPFNAETPSTDTQGVERHASTEPTQDGAAVRTEAFRRSVWRYLPSTSERDSIMAEQSNLALPGGGKDIPHRSHIVPRRAIQERLHHVNRDRVLALVLDTCEPSNFNRIASAFPSVELLDVLIQYFLTSPSLDARFWFHLPTFSPSKLRPELLSCIVAAGAVSTPDVPLRKLGFALLESSRAGNAKFIEGDNSAIRSLIPLQTLLLQLEIGMWSGMSRKMEIAESFLQPLVTMLRRGGRYRRSTWKEIVPSPDDSGTTLEEKWKEWVNQESYLRLVYRTFELDRQSSMALLKTPLISYAEMQLPLPHANKIWHASSARAWKVTYLNSPLTDTKRPSPADCIMDLEYLTHHDTACKAYLYMVWGMIWEYRQMVGMTTRSPLKSSNSLIISSRHQELTKQLEDFRVSNPSSSKHLEVMLELMLIHLNAPVEDIQLFAGIEGTEEARRAYPILRDWVGSNSARQALWHAGQMLRAVESLSKGLLCNFNAIAVYHAGLVLWAYGFLKRTGGLCSATSEASQLVSLDGDDNLSARRFINMDRGIPSIRGRGSQSAVVQLSDVSGVMDSLVCLLRANHDSKEGSCPPLVDNLIQLMEGLRSATK